MIRFWTLFNDATQSRMKKDFATAVTMYERSLAIDPAHEDSLYYLGHCRQELGDYGGAREAFTKLVTINPVSARGHLALGALLASPDDAAPFDLAGAEAHLRRAHEINGEETGPMVRLGEVLIVRKDLELARQSLEAAVRTNPKSVEAAFLSGYLRWNAGDMDGALAFYRKAIRAAKTDAPIKGVMSEGDRKAAASAAGAPSGVAAPAVAHAAAPPLKTPMGKTLFGAFSAHLLGPDAPSPAVALPASRLDAIYSPVRKFAARLASRASLR